MQPETQKVLEVMASLGTEIATRDCGPRVLLRALDALAQINGAVHEEPPRLELGPSVAEVVDGVCNLLHVDRELLLGRCRTQKVAAARQVCFWLCRKLTDRSFPEIGQVFNRDHSTVIHGVKLVERRSLNPKYARTLATMQRALGRKPERIAA